jgi:outer membrane protein
MRRVTLSARACLPAALLFLVVAVRSAAAQQPPSQTAAPGSQLTLTLDEAVKLALEHNLDLVVERLEPQVAGARVAQAASAYLPLLTSTVSRNSEFQPPSSFLVGSSGVQSRVYNADVGVAQRLPWLGTSYAVTWNGSRTSTSSVFTNFNPALGSSLEAVVSQPLLRDLSIDAARQQLIVSRRNQGISDTRLRETVVQTVNTVKKAYWDLVSANASLAVQRQSLGLAEELVRQDRARVNAGQLPELDLLAAQADATQRLEAVTVAEMGLRQSEDRLRTLVLDPARPEFWSTRLVASQPAPVSGALPDVARAVSQALQGREDLKRARLELENAHTATRYYANQRLPDLRIQANYQAVGLAGTELVRTGGFPGIVTGSESSAFGQAIRQIFSRDFPTWTVGVTLSYPIGRSYEDAGLAASRLQEAQAQSQFRNLEMQIVRQVREAGWQLETNARRTETSRAARDLAERRLDAEQKRFEVGMSTSFLVLQAQRDLAQARNNELSAVLDYTRSLADFEALQEASPAQAGTTVTVSGSSVLQPGASSIIQPAALPGAVGQGSASQSAVPGASAGSRIGGQ